jgi:hypothetical protein
MEQEFNEKFDFLTGEAGSGFASALEQISLRP